MILKELINTNQWLSVEFTLLSLYPDQEDSIDLYKEVYEKLRLIEPITGDMSIVLTHYDEEEEPDDNYVQVSGKKYNELEKKIEHYAIEFSPWNEWLGMEIEEETLASFNELEIISHCLFEMTFVSFDEEEIQDEFNALKKRADEFENMTDEEKKASTRSLDDFLKGLSDREPEEPEN